MNTNNPAPGWFKAVAIIALLWNLIGVAMYLMTMLSQKLLTPEMLEALPEADRAAAEASMAQLAATPSWVTAAFAIATFGGLLGSILLLMKKNLAVPLFAVSLLAVIAQDTYTMFLSDTPAAGGAMILPLVILVIAAFLLWVALKAKKAGWSS
jgi:hypothetical protein